MPRYLPLLLFLLISFNGKALSTHRGGETSKDTETKATSGSLTKVYSTLSIDPESVTIPYFLNVYQGDSIDITPQLSPNNAETTYTWYSKDPSVAVVRDGFVYGIGVGETDIYCVTANDKTSNNCHITVFDELAITGVTVSPNNVTMNLHETCQLSYKVIPSYLPTTVSWESDNKECAEVSQTGLVTPIAAGMARIVVKTDVGEKTDTCTVKVLPDPEKIEVPEKMSLIYETSSTIPVTVTPSDAYVEFTWTSDNPSIVRVDEEGNIFAGELGSAHITVRTHNGKEAICTVEVILPFTGISVIPTEVTMNLHETYQLSYQLIPTNGQTPVTWESDNINCVVVSETGLLTPIAAGTARITVKTDIGEKTATCMVKVLPDPEKIEVPEKMSLICGESGKIPVTVTPTEAYVEFTWTSDDTSVVSVDEEGNIFASVVGSANISVETHNGKKAICTVEVYEPEPDFWLVVWLTDGRKVVKHVAEKPEVRYSDGSFILVSEDFQAEYDKHDVLMFTLSDNEEDEDMGGLTETQISPSKLSQLTKDAVTITDGTPGAQTLVYDISGRLLGCYEADQMGTTIIALESLPIGVLIIKSETITYKILKK